MSKSIRSQFVTKVTVIDPDSGGPVEIEIRKLESGPMVGIDGSFLEQDVGPVNSPYDLGFTINISDDEQQPG
jgi:hypothetical protein